MKNTLERTTALRRALTLLASILAWVLFFYWWRRVALDSTASAATFAVVVLLVIAVVIFYSTILWIRHNIKLAKRGKRGLSTRYLHPEFERDWLDRPLVFGNMIPPRDVTWFVVHTDESQKRYSHHRLIAVSGADPG
jgi:Na+/melibiose symporter-like transporter